MEKKYTSFYKLISSINYSKFILTIGILLSLITTIASLLIPLFTKEMVNNFSSNTFEPKIVVIIFIIIVIKSLFDGTSQYLLSIVGESIVQKLRNKLWDKVLYLPTAFFDKNKSGELSSRIINDTLIIKNLITDQFPQLVTSIISIIGSICIFFIMDWKMTLIMLTSVPLTLSIILPLSKKIEKISSNIQDETASLNSYTQQTLGNIRLVKSSTAESIEKLKGYNKTKYLYSLGLQESKINAMISPLISSLLMVLMIFLVAYGGIRVSNGTLSTGELVAFLMYLFQIISPFINLSSFLNELNKTNGATKRIIKILNTNIEKLDGNPIPISISKNINFDKVSLTLENKNILNHISFEIPYNQKIAFVGPSGAGKSTILNSIERFYLPSEGSIMIGNEDIQDINIYEWRKKVGYVSQENTMIDGTIKENLIYGLDHNKISDNTIWEALEKAYAKNFVEKLSNKLNTEIGERGVKLSGGEKQRINIARIFLKNPEILLFDEATASLDSNSEIYIRDSLNILMKNRTTLIVAHRLTTIMDADIIYFVDSGEITGKGKHDELLLKHPKYKKYVEYQLQT